MPSFSLNKKGKKGEVDRRETQKRAGGGSVHGHGASDGTGGDRGDGQTAEVKETHTKPQQHKLGGSGSRRMRGEFF